MAFKKNFICMLLCCAVAIASADTYPDLPWRMDGSTVRDAASTAVAQTTLAELTLCNWDALSSVAIDIWRYPFNPGTVIVIF